MFFTKKNKENYKNYKIYNEFVSSLFPNVIIEKYKHDIIYEEKIQWFRIFNRKTTRLIFPNMINECQPLDTIVWSKNIATSVGYSEHSILTPRNKCFNNLYAILDVPINWWRPFFDFKNGYFDKWNEIMSDLTPFVDELMRKLDYVIFTSYSNDKFIILFSELHYNYHKFNVVLACFQGKRNKLSNIWSHFIPVFSIDETDIASVISIVKQIFLTQINYSKVFAAVTNTTHPCYIEKETMYLFYDLIELRTVLNISFDETLFIIPPQIKPDIFFVDFKVKIIYDPSLFSPDDLETFLKFNNIDYEIEIKKNGKLMIERKGLGNFEDNIKLIPPSTVVESLFI